MAVCLRTVALALREMSWVLFVSLSVLHPCGKCAPLELYDDDHHDGERRDDLKLGLLEPQNKAK